MQKLGLAPALRSRKLSLIATKKLILNYQKLGCLRLRAQLGCPGHSEEIHTFPGGAAQSRSA